MNARALIPVNISHIESLTKTVKKFRLERPDGQGLPPFSPGSHILLNMGDDDKIYCNPYSLVSSFFETNFYEIAVRRAQNSKGGSAYLHDKVVIGTGLEIAAIKNLFPISHTARKYLLVAGGIGITPFIGYLHYLTSIGADFELHYAARNRHDAAFLAFLLDNFSSQVKTYFSENNQTIDPAAILARKPLGTHLYVCGPSGFMDTILDAAYKAGWPTSAVHFERFITKSSGTAFHVFLSRSLQTIAVSENLSLLEALENSGFKIPNSCRGGVCGFCETAVEKGEIDHRDHFLDETTKQSHKKIMPCVSRAKGKSITLPL